MIDRGYLLGERYQILDTLGEGGMANVYLAKDIILQRQVAVKVLRLDLKKQPQIEARFQREALATSELSHPNIVSVLDVGNDRGLPYMVMEYVSGPDLKDYIKDNYPIALDQVIKIMDQILSAVALAHKHNVIHRDLKPQNILMDARGNIKIADFGIAVALNQSSITQTNSIMGSVHYMSPEQTRGGMVTKQSDIYSLGIILYELITGHVPFNGDTPVAVALKHAQEAIPSIRAKVQNIPQALENVVLKATAKDPRDRYESANAMKTDLDSSLEPSRSDEPIFVPSHGQNNDETIVMPGFKPSQLHKETTAEAKQEPVEKKKSFWQNLKRHKWWYLFVGIVGFLIVFIMIYALSGKNQEVRVPDVTNVSEGVAKARIENLGLKVGQVVRRHSDSIAAGKVIETDPDVGDTVKKGSSVALVVSSGAGMVKVPNVENDDYDVAEKKLVKMGFDVQRQDQFSTKVPRNKVITQSIAAGVQVKPKQTTITLIVSKGRSPKPRRAFIKLKNLKNYSLKSAQDYAKENDLTLQIKEEYSDSVDKGLIISTDPVAGSRVQRGSTISVTVSKGSKEDSSDDDVTKNFTVNYEADNESSDNSSRGNHVQIYIKDDSHSIGNIYRDLYIKSDMSFSIPFSLSNGDGQLRVVRDGKTILNEKVTK